MMPQFKIVLLFIIVLTQALLLTSVNGKAILVNSSGNMPSTARKAGGTLKVNPTEISSNLNPQIEINTEISSKIFDEKVNNLSDENSLSHKSSENEEYDEESSEEVECPRGKFWHIRGLRCVPLKCRGGSVRDSSTGECSSPQMTQLGSTSGVCDYCIQNNIKPFGRCCVSLLRQPHMDTRQLQNQGSSGTHYQGIRTKMENRHKYGRRG